MVRSRPVDVGTGIYEGPSQVFLFQFFLGCILKVGQSLLFTLFGLCGVGPSFGDFVVFFNAELPNLVNRINMKKKKKVLITMLDVSYFVLQCNSLVTIMRKPKISVVITDYRRICIWIRNFRN